MVIDIKKDENKNITVKMIIDNEIDQEIKDYDYIEFINLLYLGEELKEIKIDNTIDIDIDQVDKLLTEINDIVKENKK